MFSRPVRWRYSLIAAAIAVYAPFMLLAALMLLFERQWGNTETMLRFLPIAPGFMAAHWASGIVDWIPGTDFQALAGRALPPLAQGTFVVLIASLGQLGREWLVGATVAAFLVDGIVAYWLWHAIRM